MTAVRPPRVRHVAVVVAVMLIAFNLRAAVLAVSPVVSDIRDETGIGTAVAGLLTTLPALCFGAFSPLVPPLARRFGANATLAVALAVLAGGIALRIVPSTVALFAGTILLGAAMAVGNVLLPSLIKRYYPRRIGSMTGLYVSFMGAGATVAAGATVPLGEATGLGWRTIVGLWAIPAAVALGAWLFAVRPGRGGPTVDPEEATPPVRGLWRDPVARRVVLFFGMQSLIYYATIAWLPTLFEDRGMSSSDAGLQFAICNLIGLPVSLVAPMLATRARDQVALIAAACGMTAAGLIGVVVAPLAAPLLWMALLGIGQGATVGLALTLIGLRSPDAQHAAQLSGLAQSASFLIAATGPFALGALHDLSGSWAVAFGLTIAALVPMTVGGLRAGRDRYVSGAGAGVAGPVAARP
jgi:CP family cyanate transporter-like MFS transporter